MRLWRWYFLFKQETCDKNFGDANEKLVWHGTDINNIDDIVKNGFDFRLARESGALGSGIYFAASACTSLSYIKNGYRMLLCRTVLGKTTQGHRNLRRPPEKSRGCLYDAVEGCLGTDAMFCIFDNHQSYPEWVIEFDTTETQPQTQQQTSSSIFHNIVIPSHHYITPLPQLQFPKSNVISNTNVPPSAKHPVFSYQ